jgi:hypothetical protein
VTLTSCAIINVMTNCLKKHEVSWITSVVWLNNDMTLYDARPKFNRAEFILHGSNRNIFTRAVDVHQISYTFNWITSMTRSKVNKIMQILCRVIRIYNKCNRRISTNVVSECLASALLCLDTVKDLEVNVAELLNARELDFGVGYISAVNVSV